MGTEVQAAAPVLLSEDGKKETSLFTVSAAQAEPTSCSKCWTPRIPPGTPELAPDLFREVAIKQAANLTVEPDTQKRWRAGGAADALCSAAPWLSSVYLHHERL